MQRGRVAVVVAQAAQAVAAVGPEEAVVVVAAAVATMEPERAVVVAARVGGSGDS